MPGRVARAYKEFFAGYQEDTVAVRGTTFEETEAYDVVIALRDIRLESHCEHHIVPILGSAHVGYLPAGRVVGISKLVSLGSGPIKGLLMSFVDDGVWFVREARHERSILADAGAASTD